jgi:hypothetical protein
MKDETFRSWLQKNVAENVAEMKIVKRKMENIVDDR